VESTTCDKIKCFRGHGIETRRALELQDERTAVARGLGRARTIVTVRRMPAEIIELTAESFDADVLERSHETPVLVDFWAPWCGPCRALTPVLEAVAQEMDGAFVLAKANTEEHPALGQRFSVRSIPAVKLYVGGKVVGEFMGALPGSQVRRFLDTHLPSAADDLVREAEGLIATDKAGARDRLRQALEERPTHAGAHWMLANIAFGNGERPLVEHHAEAIALDDPLYAKGEALVKALSFWDAREEHGDTETVQAKLAEASDDLDLQYALGCSLAIDAQWKRALETLLEVVKKNNRHRDAAARKAMVVIFDLLGRQHELSDTYVRQLQIWA